MNLFDQTKLINQLPRIFFNSNLYPRKKNNNENLVECNKNGECKDEKILPKWRKTEEKEEKKEKNMDIHNMDNKTSQLENSVMHTASYLDIFDKRSTINESKFRGFCNLTLNVIFFFAVTVPIVNFIDKGYFFDTTLLNSMIKKAPLLILLWISTFLFSFTSYFILYLYRNKYISSSALLALQIPSEISVLIFTIFSCIYIKFPVIECGFLVAISYIHFMKMHSYVYTNLEYEKKHSGSYAVKSKNLSLKDYAFFIICPSVVYKFSFKRISKFRPKYFIQKTICLSLTMVVEYTTYTTFILPIINQIDRISYLEAIIRLMFPCFVIFVGSFYLIFECICNLSAEVTKFGERDFYQDWWNSTIWYEFSRKWNNIVQAWLHKHVYLAVKNNFKLSRFSACVITYLFSAVFHELLMMVCFRTCKFYLFFLMFLQFPLSWVGEKLYKNTSIGNMIFWSNILIGMPLIFISYANGANQIF